MKSQVIDVTGLIKGEYNYLYDLLPFHTSKMQISKKINTVLAASNLKIKSTNAYYMPISVFIEFTNYCNLRCPICATGSKMLERQACNMDPELLENIMPQINKHALLVSLWGWGESLLHPEIESMMKIVYELGIKKGVHVVVSTNGQNLDNPKVLEALIKYPPTYLITTTDGLTDEVLNVYRVGAKLQPMLDGVKWIAEHRKGKYPILHMRTIVMKQNEMQIKDANKFAKEHKFDNLSLRGLVQIIPSDKFEGLVPENKEYKSYEYKKEDNSRIHKECFFCKDSLMIPLVHANGDLCICCEDFNGKLCYGNLKTHGFKELWFGKKANEIRRSPLEHPDRKPCSVCPMTDRTRPITNMEFRDLKDI